MTSETLNEERRKVALRLSNIPLTSEVVSLFLLDEYKRLADRQAKALGNLDKKATAQVGFSGTAIALFASLGHSQAFEHHWLVVSFVSLILSIATDMVALWVHARGLPNPDYYMSYKVLDLPANKGKIAAELAVSWGEYGDEVASIAGRKAFFIRTGAALFLVGITSLAIAFLTK
jgi:hypothetical protein